MSVISSLGTKCREPGSRKDPVVAVGHVHVETKCGVFFAVRDESGKTGRLCAPTIWRLLKHWMNVYITTRNFTRCLQNLESSRQKALCARPKHARWFHPMTRDILVMHIYNMFAWMYVRLSAVPGSDPSCLLEYAYARDIHAALP